MSNGSDTVPTTPSPQTTTSSGVPGGPSTGGTTGNIPGTGTGGIPGAPSTPPAPGQVAVISTGPAPAPANSSSPFNFTPGQMAVLRKIASDGDFRVQFAKDPIWALTNADIKLTTEDFTRIEKLTPEMLEQVAIGIKVLTATANSAGLKAEGTNTLVYAIIVALLLA